ncbi:MAG: acireductone synthase [Gammaproteobacteria bacterium]
MIKAIITDIEGTTSSLSFVKDVLFPYARAHIAAFVRNHADDPEVQQLLADVSREAGRVLDVEQTIAQLIEWIDQDKKVTPLKALQGLIWDEGYRQGAFTGHIYADAAKNLQAWQASGLRLYVYSSGSVHAQKLLFAHTEYGDLTPWFSGYFDTRIGGKREVDSYRHIANALRMPPENLLFLSDIKEELDAAKQAGFHTIWLVRDGNPDPQAEHVQAPDFDHIETVFAIDR